MVTGHMQQSPQMHLLTPLPVTQHSASSCSSQGPGGVEDERGGSPQVKVGKCQEGVDSVSCRAWSCVEWWPCMWRTCSVPGRRGSRCLPARSHCSDLASPAPSAEALLCDPRGVTGPEPEGRPGGSRRSVPSPQEPEKTDPELGWNCSVQT